MLAGAPRGFFLGAATSAHQIEGGTRNDWTEWEKGHYPDGTPHVADGASAARIADSWNLWRSDLAALQLIGANAYRLGIEWSRLEPTPGAWDAAAAARYREMFLGLRAAGITPIVTLYHFTLPTWVAERGGWDWDGAPAALAAFAGRAGAAFGDVVDWWCTINEPNVLVAKGYLAAQWPPGVPRSAPGRAGAGGADARARARDARAARERSRRRRRRRSRDRALGSPRTCASSIRIRRSPSTASWPAPPTGSTTNRSWMQSRSGASASCCPGSSTSTSPSRRWRAASTTSASTTTRAIWSSGGSTAPTRTSRRGARETAQRSRLGDLSRKASTGCSFATRTAAGRCRHRDGVADGRDVQRADFLRAHLHAVDRARAEGIDVIGYLYWSLIDNFEWSHGTRGRFGLFKIDFDDPIAHPPSDRRGRRFPGSRPQPRDAALTSVSERSRYWAGSLSRAGYGGDVVVEGAQELDQVAQLGVREQQRRDARDPSRPRRPVAPPKL